MDELPPLEARFLAWCATSPEGVDLLRALPGDALTSVGATIATDLVGGHSPEGLGAAMTPTEADTYLRERLLSLIGREAGRAQKSGDTKSLHRWVDLLSSVSSNGHRLPVSDYHTTDPKPRTVIPTGVAALDRQIQGLAKGEVGICAMPPGRGKTGLLINFAVHAMSLGHSVLYVTVADQGIDELVPRVDTRILGSPAKPFPAPETLVQRHRQAAATMKGRLWVADYTDRECSIDDVARAIESIDTDLVVVDHADDVLSPHSHDPTVTRHSLRVVYMTLKKLAVKYEVPVWTASQSNEMSWYAHAATISDLSEAKVGKASGAAIVLAFTGGPMDKQIPGIMFVTIAKARRAFTERTFAVNYDWTKSVVWAP